MNKLDLVKRNSIEIIGEQNVSMLLKKKKPVTYCGYEASGPVHIGHLVTMTKLLDLQKANFKVKVLFADWHTFLNRKGSWQSIHKEIKTWKKAFKATGLTKADFILGSSFQRNLDYIDDILKMSLKTTINRGLRSMQQVARDVENARISQVLYPLMQIADIKYLKVDLVTAGIEQRKIHMLGKELFKEIEYKDPVFVHTPLIPSLKGSGKMSSSDLSSMISIYDNEKDIHKKIKQAYCPPTTKDNPILAITKLIIFPRISKLKVERDKRFGKGVTFNNYEELEKNYIKKQLHPSDLKNTIAENLTKILLPIRKAFNKK